MLLQMDKQIKNGQQLIAEERAKQLKKYSIEQDIKKYGKSPALSYVATFLCERAAFIQQKEYSVFESSVKFPWSNTYYAKFINIGDPIKLYTIAGALYLAQIDVARAQGESVLGINNEYDYDLCVIAIDKLLGATKPHDAVNHPSHYTDGKIEVIEFICDKKLGFHLGNVVKYLCRAGKKDASKYVEDLEKAEFYLHHYIEQVKKGILPVLLMLVSIAAMPQKRHPVVNHISFGEFHTQMVDTGVITYDTVPCIFAYTPLIIADSAQWKNWPRNYSSVSLGPGYIVRFRRKYSDNMFVGGLVNPLILLLPDKKTRVSPFPDQYPWFKIVEH